MTITNSILNQPKTINPYHHAAALLKRRFLWDLNPQSWISRTKLIRLKDSYKNKKAIIVCNGPSLLKSDLFCIQSNNIFTFGLNKINLLFGKSTFRPSCIVAVNPFVIEQNSSFYQTTEIPLFVDSYSLQFLKPRDNTIFLHSMYGTYFAQNCSISICQGGTVTFVAMQLAFHFGFKEVALIGCDHNFKTEGIPNSIAIKTGKDEDHFDPNYFANGIQWNLPDLATSEAGYSLASDVYRAFDRKLVNATEGGALNLLPRVSLQDFVSDVIGN
jgi:hypothetical protein